MSHLLDLQEKFQSYLLQDNSDFQPMIVETSKVPAAIRLGIYKNSYESRLQEALASNYPVLQAYVGADFFEKIAYEYLLLHPSPYRSIRWYGDKLASFLKRRSEYQVFPYLAALAEFEWVQTLAFDALDKPLLQIENVAQIPQEKWVDMRFSFHSSVYRLNLYWNVVQIWQAFFDETTQEEPMQQAIPTPWIVWRCDLMNKHCALTEDEAFAIDAAMKNLTFGEICEGLCQWMSEEDVGMHAASLLKGWIVSGLLVAVN